MGSGDGRDYMPHGDGGIEELAIGGHDRDHGPAKAGHYNYGRIVSDNGFRIAS
jgi:hypothetical protein